MAEPRNLIRFGVGGLILTLAIAACSSLSSDLFVRQSERVRRLVLLYTNDEHGWMESSAASGGAAAMLFRWRQDHGYEDDGPFLVLSGGDMWTGPAVSTLLKGRSMTDIMNRMGYDAAAVGNHDFDFGPQVLREQAAQADFPFVSANLIDRSTDDHPDFVRPYVVREVNGIRVGIVGLSTVETRVDTRPSFAQDFRFRRYEEVLLDVLPDVQAEDVDVILVIGHLCNVELEGIADVARQYSVPVMGGGHCHEEHNETAVGVRLIESGFFLRGYVRTELLVDVGADAVVAEDTIILPNPPGLGAIEIEERVEHWRGRVDPSYWETIGYTEGPIDRRSDLMDQLLTQAWLRAVPEAEVAIASRRYVQQSMPAGEITPATIVGVLPVENELFHIQLSGRDLAATIRARNPVLGGLVRASDELHLPSGNPLDPESTYEVVLPDVIYYGANYYEVQTKDPSPIETGVPWRHPVEEFIVSLDTSPDRPLDRVLAGE